MQPAHIRSQFANLFSSDDGMDCGLRSWFGRSGAGGMIAIQDAHVYSLNDSIVLS